jgi:hypothetical protein
VSSRLIILFIVSEFLTSYSEEWAVQSLINGHHATLKPGNDRCTVIHSYFLRITPFDAIYKIHFLLAGFPDAYSFVYI